MKTLTLTADNHIIDTLIDFLKVFKNDNIQITQSDVEPKKLNAISAFGLFVDGNEDIDFDEIENDLKILSRQSEQHILDKWDLANE